MLSLLPLYRAAIAAAPARALRGCRSVASGSLSAKAWKARWPTLEALLPNVRVTLPLQAQDELTAWVHRTLAASPLRPPFSPDTVPCHSAELPLTSAALATVEEQLLVHGPGLALLQPVPALAGDIQLMRLATYALTNCLGKPLVQNAKGEKSILVYDRDAGRKMADGQRYHQSHEGGSLHTDNVNVPTCWEYMFLSCLQPAQAGGRTILVSAHDIFHRLEQKHSAELLELQKDFLWELRGFDNTFYSAPILFKNKYGEPCFRWLREYMESAHHRAGRPLTPAQQKAIDTLTALTLDPQLQYHFDMRKGEILVANDMQVFHGRTAFQDALVATEEYDFSRGLNRLLQRNWLATHNPKYAGMNQSSYTVLPTADAAGRAHSA